MEDATFDGGWFEVLSHRWTATGWYVSIDDEVSWEHDDRLDALAEALNDAPGVTEAFREDREVILVAGTITGPALVAWIGGWWAAGSGPAGRGHADLDDDRYPGPADPPVDDQVARLVTGDARSNGRRVQIWVNQAGLLVLPAHTIVHGPLDPTDNPRFQHADFTSSHASALAELHAGRWIPYARLAGLRLRRPGPIRRGWRATIRERDGSTVSLGWEGTRPHAALLWTYVVAHCGADRVDGLP